jgi:hypothetical protein
LHNAAASIVERISGLTVFTAAGTHQRNPNVCRCVAVFGRHDLDAGQVEAGLRGQRRHDRRGLALRCRSPGLGQSRNPFRGRPMGPWANRNSPIRLFYCIPINPAKDTANGVDMGHASIWSARLVVWGEITGKIDTREKFRSQAHGTGDERVEPDEGCRLARVPQLPQS